MVSDSKRSVTERTNGCAEKHKTAQGAKEMKPATKTAPPTRKAVAHAGAVTSMRAALALLALGLAGCAPEKTRGVPTMMTAEFMCIGIKDGRLIDSSHIVFSMRFESMEACDSNDPFIRASNKDGGDVWVPWGLRTCTPIGNDKP